MARDTTEYRIYLIYSLFLRRETVISVNFFIEIKDSVESNPDVMSVLLVYRVWVLFHALPFVSLSIKEILCLL